VTTGAGGQAGVSSAVVDAGSGPDADVRLECDRVVASTSYVGCNVAGRLGKVESFRFVLTGVFIQFSRSDAGSRCGDVPECGSGAVGLVLAEDLRGEGRVVAEPSLCECVVKRLERGRTKCGRRVQGELGVLLVPDDVVRRCGARLWERESPDVVASFFDAVRII
jgi:hypothetical protein